MTTAPTARVETDTERAIQAALDATNVYDPVPRMVLADHLDEIGDPRAAGYRVMGAKQIQLWFPASKEWYSWWNLWRFPGHRGYWAYRHNWVAELPGPWFAALKGVTGWVPESWRGADSCRRYATRRHAEDAAALAFSTLAADHRALIEDADPGY